jgi:hypothetical protein
MIGDAEKDMDQRKPRIATGARVLKKEKNTSQSQSVEDEEGMRASEEVTEAEDCRLARK